MNCLPVKYYAQAIHEWIVEFLEIVFTSTLSNWLESSLATMEWAALCHTHHQTLKSDDGMIS